jgi:UDP-N-acetylglucosamine/UDP-N-acetylgalactosamine diphosphorylase
MKIMPSDFESLRIALESCGQSHLLQFWSSLSETEQHSLSAEILEIDVPHSLELFRQAMICETRQDNGSLATHMKPLPAHMHSSVTTCSTEELTTLQQEGLELIAKGKVATLLLAGGQGTRLGVTYPKGMYNIGLPSHKSLYQLQAERIRRLQTLSEQHTGYAAIIPW